MKGTGRTTTCTVVLAVVLTACATPGPTSAPVLRAPAGSAVVRESPSPEPVNVYAATLEPRVNPAVAALPLRVYVPNSMAASVDVIDPKTFRIIDHYKVGVIPHHVFPSWDMQKLFVGNTASNTLTELDIRTGKPVRTIPVPDPYNIYWTLDGRKAIVIAERFNRIDFRDPDTWNLIKSVPIPWSGVDHGDLTADGRYWIGSTEFDGVVVKVDTVEMKIAGSLRVGSLPIDVRLSPDGTVLYVANQGLHGVHLIDPGTMKPLGFIKTGRGAHGLQVSRDTRSLYVSNRLGGSINVIDFATRKVTATWNVGGSPDMMQLSHDGRQLWVSNRFHASVTVVDTVTGKVLKVIKCGAEAHGLTYFPNLGAISIGHNGVYR